MNSRRLTARYLQCSGDKEYHSTAALRDFNLAYVGLGSFSTALVGFYYCPFLSVGHPLAEFCNTFERKTDVRWVASERPQSSAITGRLETGECGR